MMVIQYLKPLIKNIYKSNKNYCLLPDSLYTTVGCHPTHCSEIETSGDPNAYLNSLRDVALQNPQKVVAIGECGLDYDRLHFCEKNIQQKLAVYFCLVEKYCQNRD